MGLLARYLSLGEAIVIALLALGGWLAVKKIEALDCQMGALKTSNDQLKATIDARTTALQDRARTDQNVRKLAPADVLQRLR